MNALAIITTYNEADIIGWTVRHLIAQGLDVYVIDSGSTDATIETAIRAGATVQPYSIFTSPARVSWRALLEEVEKHAEFQIGRYDWVMHCDADEIRRSPIEGEIGAHGKHIPNPERLIESFERADMGGFNAVEFRVYTFYPTAIDHDFDGSQNPEMFFRWFLPDTLNERIGQVKAWRNDRPVDIAWSGGHRLRRDVQRGGVHVSDIRISPLKLISKHYPIRSQAHGERKVFQERRGRWSDPEKDWHVQYAGIEPGHNFLRDPNDLLLWSGV